MYDHCKAHNVLYRKVGKLVVAQQDQRKYIENLHSKAKNMQWPPWYRSEALPALSTKLISGDEARELEPDLSKSIVAALWSPETGIVDSHTFMESLEKVITEFPESALVYSTRVVRVDADKEGWVIQTLTGDETEQTDVLLARNLINASGLSANLILNSLLPPDAMIPMYYARGSYATYRGPGVSKISRLIYPCPENTAARKPGGDTASFAGLGTHLTLDLNGKIKFGPDVEWISPSEEGEEDFWKQHLVPDDSKIHMMHKAITDYLPGVELSGLSPDYVGIRPKLAPPQAGFQDFVFRTDYPSDFLRRGAERNPMITLLGIESPGLTSSLAIAQLVVDRMLLAGNGSK
jgi:2-hydroxyglutarate dehydrogenase